TEEVCVRYFWGFCVDTDIITTTITTTTTNSEYTLPSNAQGGDIITISLLGDGGTLCSLAVDNLEIHILEAPEAIISSLDTICSGDDVVVTGTPNTTVTYTDGT